MDEPNVRGDPGDMFQATAEGGLDCESLDVEAVDLKSRQEILSSGGSARAIVPDLAAGESPADHEADRRALDNGRQLGCDRLLLTTGAEPRRLSIPGANLKRAQTLVRSRRAVDVGMLADCDTPLESPAAEEEPTNAG